MIETIIQSFWLLLPGAIGNMALPLFVKWKFLAIPIDFGKKFRGKRIFGEHKTWRGLVIGVITAIIAVYLQRLAYPVMIKYSLIDYSSVNAVALGIALGGGSLIGDMVKSFFKRQINIEPGKPWMPWDQVDWIIGGLVFAMLFTRISWQIVLWSLVIYGVLHVATNLAGYFLGLKKNKL